MKKVFTHIFVVLVNFYFLTYFVGIALMTLTMLTGPLNSWVGVIAMLFSLTASIIYQAMRSKFSLETIGELVICNHSKENILEQSKLFSITRIPLFILLLLTLAIGGNILDGLSEGQTFALGTIILFGILTATTFNGIKNFIRKPELLPIFMLISGLLLTGFAFKYSPNAQLTGDLMFNIYITLSVIWLIVGLIYKNKIAKTTNA
ncbi:MAG: hypothetical protein RIC35_12835 [Marinoscillum sp.]